MTCCTVPGAAKLRQTRRFGVIGSLETSFSSKFAYLKNTVPCFKTTCTCRKHPEFEPHNLQFLYISYMQCGCGTVYACLCISIVLDNYILHVL